MEYFGEAKTAIGKCPACREPVATSWTQDEASQASYQVRSTCCNRWTILHFVDGRIGKRECGEWCTTGTGKSCTCTCGGKNHGLAWRVGL
jgi:hypothetical protein